MLNYSLIAIKQKLQQNLQNHYGLDEDIVVLNQLVEQDGSVPQKNHNKMVITLLNMTQESTQQYVNSNKKQLGQRFINTNPSINFNLYLLFTACFDDYEESLKFLNSTIIFFQANPSISDRVEQSQSALRNILKFEIENASHLEIHNLWSAMGAKYRPSILYKVRYISIQGDELTGVSTQVEGCSATGRVS